MRILSVLFIALPALAAFPARAELPAAGIKWHGGLLVPMRPPAPTPLAPSAKSGLPRVIGPSRAAAAPPFGGDPGRQCRSAIMTAERAAGIPTQLMAAIARVESGRRDAQGVVQPWPWTINAEGVGSTYNTKAEAIAAVAALQASGVRSIDVGCMQVNLMFHQDAFASLDQAFDPAANARYAAGFLGRLYAQTGDWTKATAAYHSATPELGAPYQRKVAAVLPDEMKHLHDVPFGQQNVWGVNAWTANAWETGGRTPFAGRRGGFMLNIVYRFRPWPDQHKTLMEVRILMRVPPGQKIPRSVAMHMLSDDETWSSATELGVLGNVFDQDMANLPYVQEGLKVSKTNQINLGDYQEIRIRQFHRTLDKYIAKY